jgi:hypothetical protein
MNGPETTPASLKAFPRLCPLAWLAAACLALLPACQTVPPPAPVNLSEPGWRVQQGQAVWRAHKDAPEIAGELLVATHGDGRSFVQFTKPPLALVTAQRSRARWHLNLPPGYDLKGRGEPPPRLVWLHLAPFVRGAEPPARWWSERGAEGSWRLADAHTGETLEGYLAP